MFFRKVFNDKKIPRAPLDFLQIFGISAKDAAENGVDLDCRVILKSVRADEKDFGVVLLWVSPQKYNKIKDLIKVKFVLL